MPIMRDQPHHEGSDTLIEQVLTDLRELRREFREDRKELWTAMNDLRQSITGNGREGLSKQVDRNTSFRRNLIRWLWVLITPLYGGLIALLFKLVFEN